MASGSGLATALAAIKAHGAAAAVVGTLVVGGGAAAVGVATGAVRVPGITTHTQDGGTTVRAAACANNGDAQRLAGIFSPMFDGDKAKAQQSICTLFVGTDGHARGFGEIQQALEIAAAIEANGGSTACLSGSAAGAQHGTPAAKGTPEAKGTPAGGQPSFTAPSSTADATMGLVKQVLDKADHGTPLAQLAKDCGATHVTGNPGDGGNGQRPTETPGGARPTGTPDARPTGTPGARPTGTPGHPLILQL